MLSTAMSLDTGDAPSGAAAWRQIVDIVAQAGPALSQEARQLALGRLATLRDGVPAAERRLSAASLAGRTRDVGIAVLFATDAPAIAAPFLARVELADDEWRRLIPAIPPAARNILRNRRDLPSAATDVLARLAPGDLALPGNGQPAETTLVEPAVGVTQIRDLVDRIAAYRERVPRFVPAPESAFAIATAFQFETMPDGIIDWVEGCTREAIVGLSIADVADIGFAGVDGQAAGAWRRRAPFRDARLVVGGLGDAGGDWLISAAPLFNPRDGRFCGYRGDARRPQVGERAGGPSSLSARAAIAPDSMRQLVHELRTPLNAIHGFAEMIDRQVLGPVALRYRERARTIMADAGRLVAMVDDLDTSARLDSGRLDDVTATEHPDLWSVAAGVVESHRAMLAARGVDIALDRTIGDTGVAVPRSLVERMLARLVSAASGVATPGETVRTDVVRARGVVRYSVSRPAVLAGRDEATLLDPGYGPDGDWPDAPLLGLGFTLRLVGRLAMQTGGALAILPDRFELALPALVDLVDGQAG